MRPVDLIIIGFLFGLMGRTEQLRDGTRAWSAVTANVIGAVLLIAGWIWLLQTWGWYR